MNFLHVCVILLKYAKTKRSTSLIYSKNYKIFCCELGPKDRYICQCYIPQCSLLSVIKSPWHCVFMSRDEQAMITLTGWIRYGLFPLSLELVHSFLWAMHTFYGRRWIDHSESESKQRAAKIDESSWLSWACLGMEEDLGFIYGASVDLLDDDVSGCIISSLSLQDSA
jgi:hypothetical protein